METEKIPYSGEMIPILKIASSEKAFVAEKRIAQPIKPPRSLRPRRFMC